MAHSPTLADAERHLATISKAAAADGSPAAVSKPDAVELGITEIPVETPTGRAYDALDSGSVGNWGFLEPPDDPAAMYEVYRLSAYLRPIADALAVNVHTAPFILTPVLPFDRPETLRSKVSEALMWRDAKRRIKEDEDRYAEEIAAYVARGNTGELPAPPMRLLDVDVTPPSDEIVDKEIERLKRRAALEHAHAMDKLSTLAIGRKWRELWELTGQDIDVGGGTAFWEVLRDARGEPQRVQRLSPLTIRAAKPTGAVVSVVELHYAPDYSWQPTQVERTFNKFAQLQSDLATVRVWFKEYGDPRVLSRSTGTYYKDLDALYEAEWENRDEPKPQAATEILVIRQSYGGSSVYGMTAAAGLYPDLVGSRDLAEENQKAVADENIPSLMLLVGGGTIAQRSYERIRDALQERRKGRKSILVIEANSSKTGYAGGPAVQPTLHVERMKAEQTSDALFTNYDARVEEKTDGAYRFPRVALGKDKGANRAVADYMGRFTQDEVYGPRRAAKDEILNNVFFPEWGITLWKYTTPATKPRDPKVLAEILKTLTEGAILSPNEAREEAGTIFNRHLEDLQGLWTRLPPRIMTALLQTKNKELAAILVGRDPQALDDLSDDIKQLIASAGSDATGNTAPIESTDLE